MKKETCDLFLMFCLRTCAVVFILQMSVHLWDVLAVLFIYWDSSKTEIMLGHLFTTFHPLHLPCSSAWWLTFEHISNREPTHKSTLQIQGNPRTSVTLKFLNCQDPICSSDTSQPSGSLSRRFLTGSREPVTRKHFPAYARGTWIYFFPCLHCSVHSPIYKLLWAISSTVDKPGNITEAAPCICDLCFLLNIKLPRLGTSIFWNGTHGNIWWTGENRSLWPVTHTCPFVSNLSFPVTGSGIWAQQLEFQYPCMLYSWGSLDSSHPDTDHPQMQL